jgi:hypothetical protein
VAVKNESGAEAVLALVVIGRNISTAAGP